MHSLTRTVSYSLTRPATQNSPKVAQSLYHVPGAERLQLVIQSWTWTLSIFIKIWIIIISTHGVPVWIFIKYWRPCHDRWRVGPENWTPKKKPVNTRMLNLAVISLTNLLPSPKWNKASSQFQSWPEQWLHWLRLCVTNLFYFELYLFSIQFLECLQMIMLQRMDLPPSSGLNLIANKDQPFDLVH